MAREYRKIPAPAWFDPATSQHVKFDPRNPQHVNALLSKLADMGLGEGWQVDGYESEGEQIIVSQASAMMTVTGKVGSRGEKVISLGGSFGPSDGQKAAERIERTPSFAGYRLVEFRPHVDEAVIAQMSDDEVNARSKVAAVLGVKPWEVQVSSRTGGGYLLQMPRDRYLPMKHDDKLQETVENGIGKFGWYIDVEKETARAQVVPADPPMFPAVIPAPPFEKPPADERARLEWQLSDVPIGLELGTSKHPGGVHGLHLDGDVGALISGMAGAGKSVTMNGIVARLFERGWLLAVGDTEEKASDYDWCRDWLIPNGFGVGVKAAATMVAEIYESEYKRRAAVIREHGVQKFQELPESVRPAPLCVILDELQGLAMKPPALTALPADDPRRIDIDEIRAAADMLMYYVTKLIAEARASGIRVVLVTQQAQQNTGVSPVTKMNLPNRELLGANPGRQARGHALLNEREVPEVPEYIRADDAAARGVGVYEYNGRGGVFKSYYASVDDYRARVAGLGRPRTIGSEVSPALIAKHFGSSLDSEDGFGRGEQQAEDWAVGADGEPLTGRERANAARHAATEAAKSH